MDALPSWWINLTPAQATVIAALIAGVFGILGALKEQHVWGAFGVAAVVAAVIIVAGRWPGSDEVKPPPFLKESIQLKFGVYGVEIQPILDKTLFVGKDYRYFMIGGSNLQLISIDSRTALGHELQFQVGSIDPRTAVGQEREFQVGSYESRPVLTVPYEHRPYLEFEYLGNLYSIQVEDRDARVYTIKPFPPPPTLQLKPAKELLKNKK